MEITSFSALLALSLSIAPSLLEAAPSVSVDSLHTLSEEMEAPGQSENNQEKDTFLARCMATTTIGLKSSTLAFSGCPSEDSALALGAAWLADSLADACALDLVDCLIASEAAAYSAVYWEGVLAQCSLAEVATLNEAAAWWACGAWGIE